MGGSAEVDREVEEPVDGPGCRPTGDVGRQCRTSSPPRMWEGWCCLWEKRATLGARCQSGSSESAESGKRKGKRRRRRRRWVPGGGGEGGGAGEEPPSFLTAPSFMASAVDEE